MRDSALSFVRLDSTCSTTCCDIHSQACTKFHGLRVRQALSPNREVSSVCWYCHGILCTQRTTRERLRLRSEYQANRTDGAWKEGSGTDCGVSTVDERWQRHDSTLGVHDHGEHHRVAYDGNVLPQLLVIGRIELHKKHPGSMSLAEGSRWCLTGSRGSGTAT